MAQKCDICGKKIQFGNKVSHSKQHTRRSWLPNIQPVTLTIAGKAKQLNICTRCLRTQNKLTN